MKISSLVKQVTHEYFFFSKGNKVWIENLNTKLYEDNKEEPYHLATVIRNDENRKEIEVAFISISRGNEVVKYDKIMQYINPPTLNVNDMAAVEDINEVDLLSNLKNRFYDKVIFTNVGSTLIVVNPYQNIQGVFGEEIMEKFLKIHKSINVDDRKELEQPHLYDVTLIAIKHLIENKKNQAIVISGESGAGKTETAKHAMNCITYYFRNCYKHATNAKLTLNQKLDEKNLIENRILGCNPILEAFGNAKTIRNDNSSRFGKYVTIHIDIEGHTIEGAQIETYLLEKSRVCEPAESERNYHIFYHLLQGAPDILLNQLFLTRQPSYYKFLSRTKCFSVDSVDDAGLYQDVIKAFSLTGFSADEILTIHKIIAACLLLGNVSFKEEGGDVFVVDTTQFEQICALLGCTNEMLDKALTQNVRIVQNEVLSKPLKITECISYRNIFVKELYNRVFNWIVKKLNKSLAPEFNSSYSKNKIYIGLLDIFGFECFQNNSLEQLLINYTNEKLQQLYIKDIFKGETQEFIKEGISDHNLKINFKDNQHVIDLLDKSGGGLFQLLDDVTLTNQNDAAYFEAIKRMHSVNPTCKIKLRPKFSISHTARDVEYNTEGFIEKNIDEVKSTMTDLALNSKNNIIRYIFLNSLDEEEYQKCILNIDLEKSSKTAKKELKFLSSKFRNEMSHLMEELTSCQCSYIRCLKPNEMKTKEYFVPTFVFKQIRYLGILDTIKVRKEGYPIRQKFKDVFFKLQDVCWFREKNILLQNIITKKLQDDQSYKDLAIQCLNFIANVKEDGECLIGKTKIFMKQKFFASLEKFRISQKKILDSSALVIGKVYRGFKFRKEFRKLKKNIKLIQFIFRKKKFVIKMNKLRKATKLIQGAYRACVYSRAEKYKFVCYYKIQNYIIGHLVRKNVKKILISGKFLNRYFKMFCLQIRYAKIRHMKKIVQNIICISLEYYTNKYEFFAALMLQSNIRRFIVRKNHADKILRGQLKRFQFLKRKFAIIIQKNYRGHLSRNWLVKAYHAATLIQNFWVMKRYMSLVLHMRNAVKTIQKSVITFLTRKNIINSRCREFFKKEKKDLDKLILESSIVLFPNSVNINEINKEGSVSNSGYFDTFSDALEANEKINMSFVPPYDPYADNKINLFAKIVDLDIIVGSDEAYNGSWAKEFEIICKKNLINKTPIQIINAGSSHSIAINSKGRIYSWGWNNNGQCGLSIYSTLENVTIPNFNRDKNGDLTFLPALNYLKPGKPTVITDLQNLKQAVCVEDISFIVDENGNAFAFGANDKGKLGLGHTAEVNKPTLIKELQGKVKEIKSSGDINIAITSDNCFYVWPVDIFKQNYKPLRLFLDKKIITLTVTCGKNFALFLTKQGIVYTYGKSNKSGELGLGDYKPRIMPEPILSLAESGEKITQLSCGFKHCLAKNSLGKVFSWGNNSYGQLGLGHFENTPFPTLISYDTLYPNRTKIIQVSAGFRSSFFLTESRNINYCGTNGDLYKINIPVKMELSVKNLEAADDNSFSVVRILNTWNNSFSVFYCTFADLRMIHEKIKNKQKIINILNTLSLKWETDSVYPPYIEGIAGYFSSNIMKKPKEEKKK